MRLAVLFTLKTFQTTAVQDRKWDQIMHNQLYLGRAEVLHLASATGETVSEHFSCHLLAHRCSCLPSFSCFGGGRAAKILGCSGRRLSCWLWLFPPQVQLLEVGCCQPKVSLLGRWTPVFDFLGALGHMDAPFVTCPKHETLAFDSPCKSTKSYFLEQLLLPLCLSL